MLPKSKRMNTQEVETVFESGKAIHAETLYIKILACEGETKFAAIVPKKTVKNVIVRNKIRRNIYNHIHIFIEKINAGFLCAVIVKKKNVEIMELNTLLQKVGILE